MVSVFMMAYNHEKFIVEALEGIINQVRNFDIEIVVGEDCSTDSTRQIILEYADKYPRLLKLIMHKKNIGAQTNQIAVFNACKGTYIAMCEGDDYWTDPYKLQKQVDFLEANPDYAMCFHAVNVLENGEKRQSELNKSDKEETYSIVDLAHHNLMHTPSVVFRNGLINKFPDWFNESPVGDYVLHLLNAKKGLIKYFPDVMAVYRIHMGGSFSQKPISDLYPTWLTLLDNLLLTDFEPVVKQQIRQQKKERLCTYIELLLLTKQYELIKPSLKDFSTIAKTDHSFITDLFLERIYYLENHMEAVKTTGSYKLAKRLSSLKSIFKARHGKSKS
jgi:glycosyltransferase involved in cell wall biosynthesis